MVVCAGSKLTESPPLATLSGMMVALSWPVPTSPMPVTLPAISIALLDSAVLETIAVLAFCVVEKPILSTTNAKAAATITNAIITIADSIPMTPRRVLLLRLETEFIVVDYRWCGYYAQVCLIRTNCDWGISGDPYLCLYWGCLER